MNQSAIRTLQLIELLAQRGPLSLAAIASCLELNKSTAHRFTNTLLRAGYLRQDPQSRMYALTMKIVGLGSQVLDRVDVVRETHAVLEETAALTHVTAHLGVTENREVVFIDKVQGGQVVEMASRIGGRAQCHSTSLGKVLLAARPEAEWLRYVDEHGLGGRTPRTITTADRLFAELRRVRDRGYAVDNGENEDGIRCVGAPIRNHTGEVVAALSASGWVVSMTRARIDELVPIVVSQASKASLRLGFTASATP
ncbi:MAG: helix-turn-helix domain-containing protein [Actinobacteria bacterium]|nr:helix-turn-helix domain-containing protein [Actinomycetota bacterium]